MADGSLDQQFLNSCVTHDYPCAVGEKLIDPCRCGKFYLCEHVTSYIHQSCSAGTLFNHESGNCERSEDVAVIEKLCDFYKPWDRCLDVDSDADIPFLQGRCTGITPVPSSTPGGPEAQTGDNTGAIVGGVIAVLLIIALIVVLIILYKKRGKPVSHYLSFLTLKKPVDNTHYDNQDETYTEINDVMRDPVYNNSTKTRHDGSPRAPDRPPFTLSPALNVNQDSHKFKGRPGAEEVAYDNPGYTPSTDDDEVIQGNVSLNVSSQKPPNVSLNTEDETDRLSSYSGLEQASLEVPTPKAYTPLSVYTRGPNPHTHPEDGGILQLNDAEYQVPKPMPEYCELEAGSNCVS